MKIGVLLPSFFGLNVGSMSTRNVVEDTVKARAIRQHRREDLIESGCDDRFWHVRVQARLGVAATQFPGTTILGERWITQLFTNPPETVVSGPEHGCVRMVPIQLMS